MATFPPPKVAEGVGRQIDGSDVQLEPDSRGSTNIRSRLVAHVAEQGSLPPIGAMLARPLLLTICVILGGLAGFAASGSEGYRATATVQFAVGGNDVALVGLEGQTLAHRMTTEPVIRRAATSIGQPATEIAANTTATWQPQSFLVLVTSVAASPEAAVARTNAVAQATIDVLRDSISERLADARSEANAMFRPEETLVDPDAEVARRSAVGGSLGQRQEGLGGQSGSVFIARAADEAQPAGLTKSLGTAIGSAVGLFAGCLIAVLLGIRGLRAWSPSVIRRLAPGVEVLTPTQAPQVAGRIVEAGETYLAVLVTRHSSAVAEAFTADMERILSTHGRTVKTIHAPATVDETTAPLLRADAPNKVDSLVGTDMLVVVLEAKSESAAMLEGRTGFHTVILMRRYRTLVSDGLSAARGYRRAMPVLMLAE